ncbi:DegT/DnrJ/EryC1/StrS family aminotransferase [Patescibacteria group bacterium]
MGEKLDQPIYAKEGFPPVFQTKMGSNIVKELFPETGTDFFHLGRTAIFYLAKTLSQRGVKKILLPSFLCQSIINAINDAGDLDIGFYKINESLRIDFSSLQKQLVNNPGCAIYIIHFFGFVDNNFLAIQKLQQDKHLLIEDCAHALFGKYQNKFLGQHGDFGIFSFRKMLSTPDGGALLSNKEIDTKKVTAKLSGPSKEIIDNNILLQKKITSGNAPAGSSFQESVDDPYQKAISGTTKQILFHTDVPKFIKKRRDNYNLYRKHLPDMRDIIIPYEELPPEIVPHSFPLRAKQRSKIRRNLKKNNIESFTIWDELLPETIKSSKFKDTITLSQQIFSLPVHSRISEESIKRICQTIKNAC